MPLYEYDCRGCRTHVEVRVRAPVADQEPVTCVIPGHHRDGREDVTDLLRVDEGPLGVELTGRCAYESTFSYASEAPAP